MTIINVLYYLFIVIGSGFVILLITSFIFAYSKALKVKFTHEPEPPKQIQVELDGGAETGYNDIKNENLTDENKIKEANDFFLKINNEIVNEIEGECFEKLGAILKRENFSQHQIKFLADHISEAREYVGDLLVKNPKEMSKIIDGEIDEFDFLENVV